MEASYKYIWGSKKVKEIFLTKEEPGLWGLGSFMSVGHTAALMTLW